MTECKALPSAGDQGQRYEVTFYDPEQDGRRVMGWSESREGAERFCKSIRLHPSWRDPQVRDRRPWEA